MITQQNDDTRKHGCQDRVCKQPYTLVGQRDKQSTQHSTELKGKEISSWIKDASLSSFSLSIIDK